MWLLIKIYKLIFFLCPRFKLQNRTLPLICILLSNILVSLLTFILSVFIHIFPYLRQYWFWHRHLRGHSSQRRKDSNPPENERGWRIPGKIWSCGQIFGRIISDSPWALADAFFDAKPSGIVSLSVAWYDISYRYNEQRMSRIVT